MISRKVPEQKSSGTSGGLADDLKAVEILFEAIECNCVKVKYCSGLKEIFEPPEATPISKLSPIN